MSWKISQVLSRRSGVLFLISIFFSQKEGRFSTPGLGRFLAPVQGARSYIEVEKIYTQVGKHKEHQKPKRTARNLEHCRSIDINREFSLIWGRKKMEKSVL